MGFTMNPHNRILTAGGACGGKCFFAWRDFNAQNTHARVQAKVL